MTTEHHFQNHTDTSAPPFSTNPNESETLSDELSGEDNPLFPPPVQQEPQVQIYRSAGFFIRGLAYLIDLLIVASVGQTLVMVLGLTYGWQRILSVSLVSVGVLGALYFVLMTRFWGQTLGKMITGIRVVQADGNSLTWSTLLFREIIGRFLSQLSGLHLGYYWCAVHPRKQGWHDLISDTYVVYDWEAERSREIHIIKQ